MSTSNQKIDLFTAASMKLRRSNAMITRCRYRKGLATNIGRNEERARFLVDLHVPLALLLQVSQLLLPVHALLLGDGLKHFQNARHHALQTAEVAVVKHRVRARVIKKNWRVNVVSYMWAPFSRRSKISSEYSSTLSWMYILPPFLLVCSLERA